jgi:septum formation protein
LYHAEVLVLASQSPRRSELLRTAGFDFIVRARPVEEVLGQGENPMDYVRRLARAKAEASCDRVLEKPVDAADARAMLLSLSGEAHTVITGICLRHSAGRIVDYESTQVHFTNLEAREIEDYVASGEPMDKAGGYAIQGLASKFIDRIEGDYFNVMGLPLALVYRHWKSINTRPDLVR